jgi:hypothetical protein
VRASAAEGVEERDDDPLSPRRFSRLAAREAGAEVRWFSWNCEFQRFNCIIIAFNLLLHANCKFVCFYFIVLYYYSFESGLSRRMNGRIAF